MAVKKNIKKKDDRGFAILFVLSFIAVSMTITGQILYQSQIIAKTTMTEENQAEAEAAALTGVSMAKMLINLHLLAPKNKIPNFPSELYSLLNGLPIGAETLEQNFKGLAAPEIVAALKPVKGEFILNVTSENSKLNLNILNNLTFSKSLENALLNLFSTSESRKLLELYNLQPDTLVSNLKEYIKSSSSDSTSSAQYAALNTKFGPKHGPLISLEELRRIPGFNYDDIYDIYSPYFTIWPLSGTANSLNINTAPIELLASILTPANQAFPNPEIFWQKFDAARKAKSLQKNEILSGLRKAMAPQELTPEMEDIVKNIFGVDDNVFLIESRGIVNQSSRKLIIAIQNKNLQKRQLMTLYNQWSE